MSDTDSRPPSDRDAHTVYGARPASTGGRRKRWIFIVLGVVVLAVVLWIIYVTTTPATKGALARAARVAALPRAAAAAEAEAGVDAAVRAACPRR